MSPPRIAEALVSGLVADPALEDAILGDLAEEWNERVERGGVHAAGAWYWGQALRSVPHLLYERCLHRSPETTMTTTDSPLRHVVRPLLAATLLLSIPMVAMQLGDEVVWTLSDFVIMGVLVTGTGGLIELALAKSDSLAYRAGAAVAAGAAFLLVWANLAVGIIGSEANPANQMYAGVLAVGLVGSLVARFRPRGMARAMVATAAAQALVAGIAIVGGLGRPYSGAVELVVLNGFWVVLFLFSAWLFRSAAAAGGQTSAEAAARA